MSRERTHTLGQSDYARGYRMSSIEELHSLREQLAAAEATITALWEALKIADELLERNGIERPEIRAALKLADPSGGGR